MPIREILGSLPFVVTRRMSARDGYFTAGRMFALVGEKTLWLRLPVPTSAALLETDRGRPLVEASIPTPLAWVAMPHAGMSTDELHDLILTAHQSVRSVSRKARRDRSPARRRRPRVST